MDDREENTVYDEYGGLATAKSSDEQILRSFKRKSVVAQDWIFDLVANGYRKSDKKKRGRNAMPVEEGLFMSDEMQDIGVLSIAPSLSALLFELSLLREGEKNAEGKSFTEVLAANNNEVLNVVTKSICKLIAECYPDGWRDNIDNTLLSSAPFYDGTTSDGRSVWDNGGYLDAASWVFLVADSIEAFLDRFEQSAPTAFSKLKWYAYDGDETETLTTEEVRKVIREIYLASIRVTCDCIVKRDGKVLGWTFRKMNKNSVEPSLYFSYVASTVYLGLYKRFSGEKNVIDEMRKFEAMLCRKSVREKNDDLKKYRFYDGFRNAEKLEKALDWMERNGFDEIKKFLRMLSDNEIKELDLLYNVINGGHPLTYKASEFEDDGSFTLLKEATVGLAESLWNEGFGTYRNKIPFRVNMSKGPCFEDGTLVDMNVVRLSSHNNAFFNNLFVIGIILNSAYDVELARRNHAEYEKMLNIFQLAIQNTQRCYDEIEGEGLLYKIDSYILDFSDKVDDANIELAKQLRRVNMSVVPLMPLILKNNNLMSQYVVQYPQKQMTDALKDIIRNRKSKNGKPNWVWDKDGYNAITNYYYVDALISFYRYYEQYEEPLIGNEEMRRKREMEAVADAQKRLQTAFDTKEKELVAEIAKRDESLAEVRGICKGLARLVINGLIDIVDEQLTEKTLIGSLSPEERNDRDAIHNELNSFDRETDTVKLSKLVRLTEKLQLLSLLSMDKSEQVSKLLKNSNAQKEDAPANLINLMFGHDANSSKYMRNLIEFVMDSLTVVNKKSNDNN